MVKKLLFSGIYNDKSENIEQMFESKIRNVLKIKNTVNVYLLNVSSKGEPLVDKKGDVTPKNNW